MGTRECEFEGCHRRHLAKGLCAIHYDRQRRGLPLSTPARGEAGYVAPRLYPTVCTIDGCDRKMLARGYCTGHYHRWKTGRPLEPPLRGKGTYGQGSVGGGGYRQLCISGRKLYEHRHVVEQALGRLLLATEEVHHLNGNRLDNRIENLELWSRSQPAGQRVEDKVAWAIELLRLYRPEVLHHGLVGREGRRRSKIGAASTTR